ncbi:MAG TPA: nucleoside 2-deoxyribosyltransferase domain-containing protein, partial [Methanosarcina sp.]|nr:nucleoside 2-deoxyribosyltransferase domain-containing protein [Methanosarcina sp.]
DLVIFYIDPNTQSPITLLELGLVADSPCQNAVVYCPDGFWRKGNVEMVCERFRIPLYEKEPEFIQAVREGILRLV